eukprot:CAMPEP_0113302276 /NCGR_PEP_ID=MMETSP0010_2-20120614/3153_1 /TAXON_ID=216773 ORGANISM="Corethron hystrix, Strain 308" /NCGR_SAMPLE_ID=MMETSP0010_2 /ASSEMBLY_ACC=CAM_ASM_000155 /LENGTH=425 /DNA_ID=CAMNT_0000156033 /DNA_START=666 /DNA_END=1940 /DNA_ORIENTATION=- /assembly_acc=CAM_ASM_000155
MGFDQVVDWEYYDPSSGGRGRISPTTGRRDVVDPPPFDPSAPRRTRTSSGNVVRLFRGELMGRIGAGLRARGLDNRILLKEFSGEVGLELAVAELRNAGELQSKMLDQVEGCDSDREVWFNSANDRYLFAQAGKTTMKDDNAVISLSEMLSKHAPFVGVLGVLNVDEYTVKDATGDFNEWYRALGTKPPMPGSIWIVYEYAGLATAASYSVPHSERRLKMPPTRRGMFGGIQNPPPLPPWSSRARYVTMGVLRGCLESLAALHEAGVAHRSIGASSVILSTRKELDRNAATSPYTTAPSCVQIKLSDFGFAGPISKSSSDPEFRARARAFSIFLEEGQTSFSSTGFAMAEDLHALGFVFLQILLTSLAEPPSLEYSFPPTDVDTLQRLLGDIFDGDMGRFLQYCDEEPAWTNVVQLLNRDNGAGW